MQPCRSPTHFIRFHICRSEPNKHSKFYFHSDEMRLFQRRWFSRVVALLFQTSILTFFKSNIVL
ncbi:hypothetical protein HanRHA438_Chr03g0104511 [Helianthus annuus]|nr:hypothetical protein HanHA89_Chr03g0089421 [Helianthus annuus]KAJ0934179.1 hypothetical protein HanRHA438_Chr03g0104511 [Helianthus annuus]